MFSAITPVIVHSHVGLHDEISTISEKIGQDPENPNNYVQRGDVYLINESWDSALADFRYAQMLDPGLAAADLGLGKVYLGKGLYEDAVITIDRLLASQPGNVRGLVARAEAHQLLGNYLPAATDYGTAIEQFRPPKNPLPQYYLARARAYAAAGDAYIETALEGLDEGLQRLGNVISLQLYAIELERAQHRYEAALERLNLIIAQSVRQESWRVQKGEILIEAGQGKQAIEAFNAALAAIETLPPHRRSTRWVKKLQARIEAGLESLGYYDRREP